MTPREAIEKCPNAYLIIGDLEKPFHLPECECDECEQWRTDNDRLTRAEVHILAKAKIQDN